MVGEGGEAAASSAAFDNGRYGGAPASAALATVAVADEGRYGDGGRGFGVGSLRLKTRTTTTTTTTMIWPGAPPLQSAPLLCHHHP